MGILDKIKGNPFEKLKKDDLIAERIRLEREEKLRIAKVDKASQQFRALIKQGSGESSEAKRRSTARQMLRLEREMALDDKYLKNINDQLRVVDNLVFTQESQELLAHKGIMTKLTKLPASKLEKFLAQVNLQNEIAKGNVDNLLEMLDGELGLLAKPKEDEEIKRYMDVLETANEAEAEQIAERLLKERVAREREEEELETL
ncbi:hypothetical protein M1O52_00625 [Dehalococcoidia bacterium]|nr:hypothetical protein [Dehalococcoidia bacterium]